MEAAAEKKAESLLGIDLRGVASFTDGFVIATGAQRRQTQAIADAIIQRLQAAGERVGHLEGYDRGEWILLDLADVVVHVFTPETRDFYALERLWGDAPRIDGDGRDLAPGPPRPAPRRRSRPRPAGTGRRNHAGKPRTAPRKG